MGTKKSKVHPKFKTKYRVRNWAEYDRALVRRGDLTIWLSEDALDSWTPTNNGRRGAQRRYSDMAIEMALTLRLVYRLPWRQTEGLLTSVLRMLELPLSAPDHTTMSRRSRTLSIRLRRRAFEGPLHLVVDSTGLKVHGEGEWASWKHGKGRARRGWGKLHLGVDSGGYIVASALTTNTVDDASVVAKLLAQVPEPVSRFTADGAYDAKKVYEALSDRPAPPRDVVIPPKRGAVIGACPDTCPWRADNINLIGELGRRGWQKARGYHQQARVENGFFRYKQIIGGRLRARSLETQTAEVKVACNLLNTMTEMGRPVSEALQA